MEGISAVIDRRYNRLAKHKTTELYELDADHHPFRSDFGPRAGWLLRGTKRRRIEMGIGSENR